jgi:putative tricarboxylic transport membrane protein
MQWRAIQPQEAALGAGLLALAAAVVVLSLNMTVGFSYDRVGPRAFPYLIAAILALSGIFILTTAVPERRRDDAGEPIRWLPIAIISGTLIFSMLCIRRLGWIPTATIAFALVAMAFGERRLLLNLFFGLLLACGTFVLFNYGLRLRLPVGTLIEAVL